MKTLTEKQPWAYLICSGLKDIENRTWATKFRGRVLIHASAKPWTFKALVNYLTSAMVAVLKPIGFNAEWVLKLQTSAIIGSVEIVDCVVNHESIWAEKTSEVKGHPGFYLDPTIIYNWVLANPILFHEPIPAKGKLSFWDYPNILAEPEDKGGELFCHCQLPIDEKSQVMSMGDHFRCRYCGGRWYK